MFDGTFSLQQMGWHLLWVAVLRRCGFHGVFCCDSRTRRKCWHHRNGGHVCTAGNFASVHGFMHETSDDFFYSVITFLYTKYFVHSFTVDVVFTLSYFTHVDTETKWSPFFTWHFQLHFLEWIIFNLKWHFIEICDLESNCQMSAVVQVMARYQIGDDHYRIQWWPI